MNRILMYHSIGEKQNGEVGAGIYYVSIDKFKEQIECISAQVHKCSSVKIELTFDDGLLDNYTNAYPILKGFGMKAYFFILAGMIGKKGYMNWQQIEELKNAGMIIGSHGLTHKILTEMSDMELDEELKGSKEVLEDYLGCDIDYFSIPRGFYNSKIIDKAKKAGYKRVFSSKPSDNNGFVFGRIPVKSSWNIAYFKRVLNSGLSFKDRAGELVKNSSKKLLGARNYDRMRTGVLGRRRIP